MLTGGLGPPWRMLDGSPGAATPAGLFAFPAPLSTEIRGMTDDEFLHAFLSLTLPHSGFRHRDHVRIAWLAVRRHGAAAAETVVADAIRRFAAANGHGERFHQTLTSFWVRLVAHAAAGAPDADTFDRFVARYPLVLDSQAPLRHWTRAVLFGAGARRSWQEPDVAALPF
jgi:hypothetical protein